MTSVHLQNQIWMWNWIWDHISNGVRVQVQNEVYIMLVQQITIQIQHNIQAQVWDEAHHV